MNRSGDVAGEIFSRFSVGLPNLLVILDTMDLPAGTLRLKLRGSSAGHRGLKSLIGVLGTEDFMRLYVGVGRPGPGTEVIAHVLGEFAQEEAVLIEEAAGRAARGILRLLVESPEAVMNELNTL
jgi:PTH1 family peptidyl-tRNA hydrolase